MATARPAWRARQALEARDGEGICPMLVKNALSCTRDPLRALTELDDLVADHVAEPVLVDADVDVATPLGVADALS
eukprot:2383631-Rhodomonas_salina.1